ncbi:EamA family transporter RarD [Sphingomonas sp.]|uniref:EamA family transporter RarD n=1 Tax=Sphingomonas sp. TaxID=28214 RepID=UPI002C842499|nr:EamA family transporter RarD [Sphingomonas sp.]HTG37603.1 EamA family transporter RarD [Sphingomonas sp.]
MTHPPADAAARSTRVGLFQASGAYLIWGLLPLYFLLLKVVDAGEIVANRVVWSLALLFAIVALMRRGGRLRLALSSGRTLRLLTLSAALISVNWLVYIWSVQHAHVLEASLGYFLNPLVNVVLGVLVLRERLSRPQMAAVVLAALGVLVLALEAGDGLWISLTLAITFGLYGLVRKVAPVESIEGLTIETLVLTPFAIAYLLWLGGRDALTFGDDMVTTALLVVAGVVTAIPLLLFAAGARRLPYSVLGLLQYLAPTLQFLLAITLLGEHMTTAHAICFALIWSGLAVFVMGSIRRPRVAPV